MRASLRRAWIHLLVSASAMALFPACSAPGEEPAASRSNALFLRDAETADGGSLPRPNDTYDRELRDYVGDLAGVPRDGGAPRPSWKKANINSGISMFACQGTQDGTDCFSAPRYEAITDARNNLPALQSLKLVRQLPYPTMFWVRSSSDGRYVGASRHITDLFAVEKGYIHPDIPVSAPYDPYFFPGNDGFSYAGAGPTSDIVACKQSILVGMSEDEFGEVTFAEAGCKKVSIGVYQSIGQALEGGSEYVVANSPSAHTNDPGSGDLEARFGATARSDFVPMVLSSTGSYDAKPKVTVAHPFEGDVMLSPTGGLCASQLTNGTKQIGYRIRVIETVRPTSTSPNYAFNTRKVATIDLLGGKPAFSFDERFIAVHSYAKQADPHLSINADASDIVIVDLKTGAHYQMTKMPQKVRALYPHFRNDGWLYFLVRDANTDTESILASDLAARIVRGG
ncbi:hypothetical protein LVJ94_07640 [Pendulispora rubella]|uniref:Uncharacterized protein n=1 Tax=Pendulispora rubella TaxID=2741070 RepID=A0ABZ2L9T8_9BACT